MKKKHIIGLGTLLLVLLLGLSTTSYADLNRTWTENNIKNAIYNYRHQFGETDSQIESYINTNASYITAVTNAFNSYNYVAILYQTSGYVSNMAFQVSNNNAKWYLWRGSLYADVYSDSKNWIFPSSGTAWVNNGFQNNFFNTNYYYTSKDIYESYQSNTIILPANSCIPSNLITTPYEDRIPFSFVLKSADVYADVWTYEDVPFYNASGEDLYIGQLFVPLSSNLEEVYSNFYWRYGIWNFRSLSSSCIYLDYVSSENDTAMYDVYLLNDYIYENTLYDLTYIDKSTEPFEIASAIFYIRNNYTIVTSGVLNTGLTFSGDYKEKYDNELQNEQDINNISEAITGTILDDSEVDNILGQFNTSGEIKEALGFHDYADDSDLPFTVPRLFIEHVIVDTLEVLVTSGDTYVDIPIDNNNHLYRVYARYFTTPEDNPLMLFVRTLLIFGSIYCLYTYFVDIADSLTTFNLYDVTNKVDTDRYIYRM